MIDPARLGVVSAVSLFCALAPSARAQCDSPQGNARLSLRGLVAVRSTFELGLSGRAYAPFLIAAAGTPGPIALPFGTLCLGADLFVVHGGALPGSGDFSLSITVPYDPGLIGAPVHLQGLVVDDSAPSGVAALSNALRVVIEGPRAIDVLFRENFESPADNALWVATNGVWQIGTPTSGPGAAPEGAMCAATNLGGDYPDSANSTLWRIRFPTLPSVAPGEELRMTYKVWFSIEKGWDHVTAVVSTDGGQSWQVPAGVRAMSGWCGGWTQANVDLTPYAGQSLRIGFRFQSNGCCTRSSGAYLDDITVFRGTPFFDNPQGFEGSIGEFWGADEGVWQVGATGPSDPCAPYAGSGVAATVLNGHYPDAADSRLTSPLLTLPAGEPMLLFWHCFSIETGWDYGTVEVRRTGEATWTRVAGPFSGWSAGWTQAFADLTAFAGQRVQIAFRFQSNGCCTRSTGWYVDEVRIQ